MFIVILHIDCIYIYARLFTGWINKQLLTNLRLAGGLVHYMMSTKCHPVQAVHIGHTISISSPSILIRWSIISLYKDMHITTTSLQKHIWYWWDDQTFAQLYIHTLSYSKQVYVYLTNSKSHRSLDQYIWNRAYSFLHRVIIFECEYGRNLEKCRKSTE